MKKILSLLLMILLMTATASFLFSCGDGDNNDPQDPDTKEECSECIDLDGDGLCDTCQAEILAEELPKDDPATCSSHSDKNYDGKCDKCKGAMENAIPLIANGVATFSFVSASGIGGEALMAIDKLTEELKTLGFEVNNLEDKASTATEYEILFGEVKSRGNEYKLDSHLYGTSGYVVKVVGKKIVVLGGSKEALTAAISAFRTQILGITDGTKRIISRVVYPDLEISVVRDDYDITALSLCGEDMRGYKIFADTKINGIDKVVTKIQNLFYEKTGYWFEHSIEPSSEAEKGIYLSLVDKCGEDGFEMKFEEGRITVNSEYSTSLSKVPLDYFTEILDDAEGAVAFTPQHSFTKDAHSVYYEDFGAVGDGVTNDAEAIIAAHKYAEEGGHKKVVGKSGAVYYIAEMSDSVLITCDVDWTGAKFIIDDSVIGKADANTIVFHVPGSGYKSITPSKSETITAINENGGIVANNIKKLDLGLGYAAMLVVYNTSHKNYIRYGPNANVGDSQSEIVLVDAEGNIDPSTPFMLDYEKITSIAAYRIDHDPLTIEGGEITTVANNQSGTYYSRGIYIARSNVTVRNLSHYIVGEGEVGSPYGYFTDISYAYNLLFENCVYSGHKTYYSSGGIGKGSYDITTHYASHVTWKNCNQINFFTEDGAINSDVWGVMGGGHSKNISFIGSRLNRFDAHSGVLNAYIVDCEIVNITIVGGGDLLLQNSKVHNIFLIQLRDDYGSFWHGDVTVKDVTMVSNDPCYILNGHWYNHDFGYATAMPRNITIDGLKIEGTNKKVSIILSAFRKELDKSLNDEFTSTGTDGSTIITPNVNKTVKTESITVKNNTAGLEFVFPTESTFFADTVMTEIPFEG